MRVHRTREHGCDQDGTVLIIVLWIALGLVSIALYFGNSSSLELRAADNRVAATEASQAVDGAARYAVYVLAHTDQPGVMPDPLTYQRESVAVGDARFWFLGRDYKTAQPTTERPYFGLIDEASKLNINTATVDMLTLLPRMTPELAAAIIDWRDADSDVTENGAEDETYLRRNPPYHCKNAKFESIEEMRLLAGADMEILFGEDPNLNGVLDPNENDGPTTLPVDNRDGRLDPGVLEYVTVSSRESNTLPDGTKRVNVNLAGAGQRLAPILQEKLGSDRANQILGAGGGGRPGGGGNAGGLNGPFRSVLEFFVRSGMTANEFSQIETNLTASAGNYEEGLVNVNTASEAVLTCIPGIGADKAPQLTAYRQSNPDKLNTVSWVAEVLDRASAIQAGPYLTGHSYQYTADVVAVGHYSRGYRRTRFVIDTSEATPRITARRDLSHLGWALGREVRERQQQLVLNQNQR